MPIAPLPAGTPGTSTTFGSDFSGVDDIDANWSFLENSATTPNAESLALAQAIARRLTTPRGGLFYDPGYGYDLRELIGSSTPPAQAIVGIESECRKDQRVIDCTTTISVSGNGANQKWTIEISGKASTGASFSLTVEVSKVTVTLLNAEGTA